MVNKDGSLQITMIMGEKQNTNKMCTLGQKALKSRRLNRVTMRNWENCKIKKGRAKLIQEIVQQKNSVWTYFKQRPPSKYCKFLKETTWEPIVSVRPTRRSSAWYCTSWRKTSQHVSASKKMEYAWCNRICVSKPSHSLFSRNCKIWTMITSSLWCGL